MTDKQELQNLIDHLRARGALVTTQLDAQGYPVLVAVANMRGFGPYPMSAISFAERAREVLHASAA